MPGPGPFSESAATLTLNCTAGSGTVTVTANGTVVFSGNQTIAAGSIVRTAGGQVFTLIDALAAATTLNVQSGSSPRYSADDAQAARWAESAVAWTVSTEVETRTNGINVVGKHTWVLDYNALAVGERVRVRVYLMTVTGGTSRPMDAFDVVGASDNGGTTQLDIYNQSRILAYPLPPVVFTDTNAIRITVTQINGTARTLVQSIRNEWDGTANATQVEGTDATDVLGTAQTGDVYSLLNSAMADSIPADGSRPSPVQAIYMAIQFLLERAVSGTTCTVKKVDGSTTLMTLTLNDTDNPTSITRTG